MDLSFLSVRSLQESPASILHSYLSKENNTYVDGKRDEIDDNRECRYPSERCSAIPNESLPKRRLHLDSIKQDTERFSENFNRSLSFAGDAAQTSDESTKNNELVSSEEKGMASSVAQDMDHIDEECKNEPMDLSLPKVNRETNSIEMQTKDEEENDEADVEILQIFNEESHLNHRRPRLSSDSLSQGLDWNSLLGQTTPIVPQLHYGRNQLDNQPGLGHPAMVNQNRHVERPVWTVRSTGVTKKFGHRSIHLCNDSYVAIIAEIILKSSQKRVLLRDIYEEIEKNGVVMRTLPRSWKGIIRHRLTVNECFIKCSEHTGSYRHFWTIHPSYLEQFSRGIFTSARNTRSSSLSSVQHGNEEEKDRMSHAIIKCKSVGDSEIAIKHRVQLSIPKLR